MLAENNSIFPTTDIFWKIIFHKQSLLFIAELAKHESWRENTYNASRYSEISDAMTENYMVAEFMATTNLIYWKAREFVISKILTIFLTSCYDFESPII